MITLPENLKNKKVAIVHDWLTGMRGGEKVLEAICELFPSPEIFTLIAIPEKISPLIRSHKIHTSILQKIPGIEKKYRHFLPLLPTIIEKFDLSTFDLIISSSHCVAKGIKKPPFSTHISYVHAPMRYMWDRFEEYFGKGQAKWYVRLAALLARPYLRQWDFKSSQPERINLLIANSHFISERIEEHYGRKAIVIHPFADLERFQTPRTSGDFYLMVGALAPYKRIDIAISAFNHLGLPLKIVGDGQDYKKLKEMAGPKIEFLGALPDQKIEELLSQCKAFVFTGIEDFGITLVEAMAAGTPVIALQSGGAMDIHSSETASFYFPQDIQQLTEAILKVESQSIVFDENLSRKKAASFSKTRFQQQFIDACALTIQTF